MAYVEWTPALETGVEMIDEQHRRLFALINALHEATLARDGEDDAVADALYELADYVTEHFDDEEALMASHAYAELPAHHEMHQRLSQKTLGYMAKFVNGEEVSPRELAEFLGSWLQNHILEQDRHFVATIPR
jgi:hemerythrin